MNNMSNTNTIKIENLIDRASLANPTCSATGEPVRLAAGIVGGAKVTVRLHGFEGAMSLTVQHAGHFTLIPCGSVEEALEAIG